MSDEDTSESGAESALENLHHVAPVADVDPGERVIVDVDGVEIAVFNVDGEYHGLLNYCVHQGGPLAEGLVSGEVTCEMTETDWELCYEADEKRVACPWHGWQFDIASGEHTATSEYRIPTYEVVVRDGELFVEF